MSVFVIVPFAAEIVSVRRCNRISTFAFDRSCAVSVIRAGVRYFGFGDITAVVLTNVPMSVSVIVPFAAEIVSFRLNHNRIGMVDTVNRC